MKTSKTAISVLFLSAVCVTPAFANYFSNPTLGLRFNVGSAPNPTRRDVRENHMPQMTRVTKPAVDVATSKDPAAPMAAVEQAPVEQPAVRTSDASGPIPALRLRYL
jgi:hypothetical protein